MRRTLVLVLALVLALATVGTVAAAESPMGPRVNIVAGTPTMLPADTPFHVIHGWGVTPNLVTGVGVSDFRIDVDGVDMGKGSLQNTGAAGGGAVSKLWLYNFDDGLPQGTRVITGHWFLPCEPAVAGGLFPGPCPTPNAPVEVFTIPLTVIFS